MSVPSWWDLLAEGVVLIEGERVTGLNAAAGRTLRVDPEWAAGKDLFHVLRNNRLEAVWRDGTEAELTLGERSVKARRIPSGLVLEDVTAERRASETARELLAVLSHELRTPITTVTSTLEALDYDDLPEDQRRRLLGRAISEAQRVVRLLQDLTVGVDPPRERTIALDEVVQRAQSLIAPTLQRHGVTLRAAVVPDLVWADPDKLLQVVLNLVENAAVHGPEGSVVDLSTSRQGDWIELQVSDRGEALPSDVEERLFTPYSGGDRSRGRGLGLYVVRSIVDRWGGRVWYSRWTGEAGEVGNRFHALLPSAPTQSGPMVSTS